MSDLRQIGPDGSSPWADRGQVQGTAKTLDGKYLRHTLESSQSPKENRNPNTKRILEDTHINKDLLYKESVLSITFGTIQKDSYKEKTSTPKKRCQPSITIKVPIPSQIKVRIIYPSLTLQSCENSSNLTFGGYLASTTSVLSVTSFLFSLVGIVTSVQGLCSSLVIFTASSIGAVCGKRVASQLQLVGHTNATRIKGNMVLTRSMATTNNIQEDEPQPTALERQVLTLTATVERLTRQNQILKEQL